MGHANANIWHTYEACKQHIAAEGLPAWLYEQRLAALVYALGLDGEPPAPAGECYCREIVGDEDGCPRHGGGNARPEAY